jgi:outer membrane lipoprotein-sorting protein
MILALCLVTAIPANPRAQETTAAAPMTTDQVVEEMVKRNAQRTEDLQSYSATRSYHVKYQGISSLSADLEVTLTYQFPDKKEFKVLGESGSELLRKRVLRPLLQAELEAVKDENRSKAVIRPENYEFRAAGYEQTPEGNFYVLEIKPKNKSKFLVRGRIWVDGEDFGIARMEGEPSVNPSWWLKRTVIHASFQKTGKFWLPLRNESQTQLRMIGKSWLTIDYGNYKVLKVRGDDALPGIDAR